MIVGIDPGKTGALCFLSDSGDSIELRKMTYSAQELRDILCSWDVRLAVVEHVSAGGAANKEGRRMGATSAFTFGTGFGVILGVLAGCGIAHELVRPQTWTSAMGERGKDKASHHAHAMRLFPGAKIPKYAADSVLLAVYGRRFL